MIGEDDPAQDLAVDVAVDHGLRPSRRDGRSGRPGEHVVSDEIGVDGGESGSRRKPGDGALPGSDATCDDPPCHITDGR
jgi:hypothetical protein